MTFALATAFLAIAILASELYLARQSNKRLLAMITETRNLCTAIYNASPEARSDADIAQDFGLTNEQLAAL